MSSMFKAIYITKQELEINYSQPSVSDNSESEIQPTADLKYFLKIPESSKKQYLNLLHASNYLLSTYIVFTTIDIIYIVLGIISNLEMI